MYVISGENYKYVPVDFNMFCWNAVNIKKDIRYNTDYYMSDDLVDEIVTGVVETNDIWIVDMRRVTSYPNKSLRKLKDIIDKIVFVNVDAFLQGRLSADLEELVFEAGIAYSKGMQQKDYEMAICVFKSDVRKRRELEIIASLVEEKREAIQLSSSGLYSNYYVNSKKLFLMVEELYYIVFCLAGRIHPHMREFDAIVSSSKNGAIIANIIGGLLDIKEVHIIGVGPKYAMELGDSIECIKSGKKYAYIFDFMCTGTEYKLVSALINSKKGTLSYAAGIAKFREETGKQVGATIDALATTIELGLNYKVFGDKSDYEVKR